MLLDHQAYEVLIFPLELMDRGDRPGPAALSQAQFISLFPQIVYVSMPSFQTPPSTPAKEP